MSYDIVSLPLSFLFPKTTCWNRPKKGAGETAKKLDSFWDQRSLAWADVRPEKWYEIRWFFWEKNNLLKEYSKLWEELLDIFWGWGISIWPIYLKLKTNLGRIPLLTRTLLDNPTSYRWCVLKWVSITAPNTYWFPDAKNWQLLVFETPSHNKTQQLLFDSISHISLLFISGVFPWPAENSGVEFSSAACRVVLSACLCCWQEKQEIGVGKWRFI